MKNGVYIKSKTKNASQIDFSDGFTSTTSYRTLALDTLSEKDDFRLMRGPKAHPVPVGFVRHRGHQQGPERSVQVHQEGQRRKTLAKTFDDDEAKANFGERLCGRREQDCPGRQEERWPEGDEPPDPTYKLPTFVKETPPVPRFIKDNLDT